MRSTVAKLECLVVFLILMAIAYCGGAKFSDWSAACAVFLGFLYAQRSFDAVEALEHEKAAANHRSNSTEMQKIFVLKEFVWMTTFYAIGSYPLLCGAFVFAAYPSIRRSLRRH